MDALAIGIIGVLFLLWIFVMCGQPGVLRSLARFGDQQQTRQHQFANQLQLQTGPNLQRVRTIALAPSPSSNATVVVSSNGQNGGLESKNTREYLVRRMQQGVVLKNNGSTGFADFGIDDPVPVEACAICQVDFDQGDRVVTSTCTHIFHRDCLLEWVILNKDCPCCRRVFVDPEAASLRPALALDFEGVVAGSYEARTGKDTSMIT